MVHKMMKVLLPVWVALFLSGLGLAGETISFFDNFEKGLSKWDLINTHRIQIVDSGDPQHGKVLSLCSGGPGVYALIKGSQGWSDVRIEGDVYFPFDYCHYMGLIYNYNAKAERVDFGSIFLLGPLGEDLDPYYKKYRQHLEFPPDRFLGNVILVNPHRDSNASRVLYSEYWVTVTGKEAVRPREWHHFKAEIKGPICHFYVGDMEIPKVTFAFHEYTSGQVGFKPRFVGSEIRLDNIRVSSIEKLSYQGAPLPAGRNYQPEKLLTDWDVIGPFNKRVKELEQDGYMPEKEYLNENETLTWRPFKTDARGCVAADTLCARFSGKIFAYFHTEIRYREQKEAHLEFSSSDPLVLWVNNKPVGDVKAQFFAWYDFWQNPAHKGEKVKIALNAGENHIVVLVKGGRYGGDGFFAYLNTNSDEKQ